MSVLVAPDQAVSVTRPPAASMYIYATEMVRHYYRRVGLKGQRVLTVAGSGDQVLNVRELSKGFGEKKLWDRVTLLVRRGERIGIIGPNGGDSIFGWHSALGGDDHLPRSEAGQ